MPIIVIDILILSAANQRQSVYGRRHFNEPRRIVLRIIKSHPSAYDEGYVSTARRRGEGSIN